jgi:hypothetical protein
MVRQLEPTQIHGKTLARGINEIASTVSRPLHADQTKEYPYKIILPTNLDLSVIAPPKESKEATIKKIHESEKVILPGIKQTYKKAREVGQSIKINYIALVLHKCKTCHFNKTHTQKTYTKPQRSPPINHTLDLSMDLQDPSTTTRTKFG